MIEGTDPRPGSKDWSDALLTSGTEALLGAFRNYIGPVRTPYDKRDLVRKLEAFLRRAETKESLLALLDPLDIRILGSSLLLGSVPEQILKEIFIGELPLFELGVRISNLLDRLLLFRYPSDGQRLIAINPLLKNELQGKILEATLFFSAGNERSVPALGSVPCDSTVTSEMAVALFSFLFHSPLSLRKGGGLTKRAVERAAALLPGLASVPGDRLGILARSLSASGALLRGEDDERCPDRGSFERLVGEWDEDLPYFLAASVSIDRKEGQSPPDSIGMSVPERRSENAANFLAIVLASGIESLPRGLSLPRAAIARWLRIVARRAGSLSMPSGESVDPAAALPVLEAFGLLRPDGGGLVAASPRVGALTSRSSPGRLVAEGSHALHLMPEASLEDRLFVSCVARPVTIGTVWSMEVERETVRRAFAAGLTAAAIVSRFESMSGSSLPQSFAFSLSAWEEEYRSLRLYRGFVLAADERQRLLIDGSPALDVLVAERLGPGLYFLSAGSPEEAIAALAAAGLEAPPLTQARARRPGGHGGERARLDSPPGPRADPDPRGVGGLAGGDGRGKARRYIDALRQLVQAADFSAAGTGSDPEPRLAALRAALASSGRTEEQRRELADRIERRLMVTEQQIAQADPRSERLEAGGLDYLGKVRVIERALRASGDRLEILYRLPGEEPVRALLRPVRLDKNEKGLVLEAEDLGTGGPARVPLGAVSTVRRLRASLFGEEQ